MMLVAVFIYVIMSFMCFWSIEIVIKYKNLWFLFHAVSSFVLAVLYVLWYYGEGWIVEALIFLVGGILLNAYRTSKAESNVSELSDKSKFLTYLLVIVLIFTIIIRTVF